MLKVKIRMGTSYSGCPAEEREIEYDGTEKEFENDHVISTEILNMLSCGEFGHYFLDIDTEEVPDEENDSIDD